MKQWIQSEREVVKEIMSTDVFVKIVSLDYSKAEMDEDVNRAFVKFRDFERRMSRFMAESELSRLNRVEKMIASEELFLILEQCKKYYLETGGLFDPSILVKLKREGYGASFGSDQFGQRGIGKENGYTFSDVQLERDTRSVQKPAGLLIDLGGIGKGYIVDRVVETLEEKYEHVFVCAGGDIAVRGADRENGYDFWASDVEYPLDEEKTVTTLVLKNCSVATSGTNRRTWTNAEGNRKHHLIDTRKGISAETDLASVTVVAPTTIQADVWAKVLCILGLAEGTARAESLGISALFVALSGKVSYTQGMEKYRWRE